MKAPNPEHPKGLPASLFLKKNPKLIAGVVIYSQNPIAFMKNNEFFSRKGISEDGITGEKQIQTSPKRGNFCGFILGGFSPIYHSHCWLYTHFTSLHSTRTALQHDITAPLFHYYIFFLFLFLKTLKSSCYLAPIETPYLPFWMKGGDLFVVVKPVCT